MREAIGSYWLTGIVITFIVLFTGYMCLSINMNKAHKVKNEVINIIQKNNGLDDNALDQILDYMTKIGYRTTGNCNGDNDKGYSGFNVNGQRNDNKAVFCVKQMTTDYIPSKEYLNKQFPKSAYYQIKVFFSIDLPIVRNFFTFALKGSTKKLFYPCEQSGGCLI